jgi:Transposase DNA-binding
MDWGGATWLDDELAECDFGDQRLNKRLRMLVEQIEGAMGDSIPLACQDWANTKAAYRFLSNERVCEADIFAGHFQSTSSRSEATDDMLLVLHDTTEFSFQRDDPSQIGLTKEYRTGKKADRRKPPRTVCGILMHSSLVTTVKGVPLGLAAVKFWTRKKFKGSTALKRKINPTRVPIGEKESVRWLDNLAQSSELLGVPERCVHIGDRESDIFELFCLAKDLGTHFVVRTCNNRRAGHGDHTVEEEMEEAAVKGLHRIEVRDARGEPDQAVLQIKYRRVQILPPIGKSRDYPALTLWVIHAEEATEPQGRKRISWKLVTDLPIRSRREALEKIQWYAGRWKIETFHKILKSGCKAEDSKLRTAQRLTNLISIFCIVSWRIFWMTMINRAEPEAPPASVLTETEIRLLDGAVRSPPAKATTLSNYLTKLARLGGYLARAGDPPPGNTVIWRGLSRLRDIEIGAKIMSGCG